MLGGAAPVTTAPQHRPVSQEYYHGQRVIGKARNGDVKISAQSMFNLAGIKLS